MEALVCSLRFGARKADYRCSLPRFRRTLGVRSASLHSHSYFSEQLSIIKSQLDTSSADFKDNQEQMRLAIENVRNTQDNIRKSSSTSARQKHLERGKLLVPDRIAHLIDSSTSFLELSPLAAHDIHPSGLVTGIGTVSGVTCMIIANDSTVKGGTYYPLTVKKHLRAQEIAAQNRLPCIYLADSGGANLPHQKDVFPDRDHFGRIFYNQARMSAAGIPQISVVMGPCTAGGAYVPSMSDESIIVKEQGHVFLAGPPLVKAATGEEVTAEELGGGRMHCEQSGVTDYLAVDDAHALVLARRCVSNLNWVQSAASHTGSEFRHTPARHAWKEPLYNMEELNGVVGTNLRRPIAAHEVIARIVDGSEFAEFKPDFGKTMVTGFAKIHGNIIGVLASNGPLFSPSALKSAHFVQLCTSRKIPMLFLQNISGFMVGRAAESGGIAKDGAKLVTAVACAAVPKFTVVFGASYGAGNYGMCGRAYEPRFLWTWPNSRTAVMGAEQVAGVMGTLGRSKNEVQSLRDQVEHESQAIFGSARLWDDGIIEPAQTRSYLAMGLDVAICGQRRQTETAFGVFRM